MPIPFIIMGAMAAMALAGSMQSAQQQKQAGATAAAGGQYQNALAQRQAQALEQRALQQSAAGQYDALVERRQGNLISGRSRALAAASGFAMNSPSIIQHLTDIDMDTTSNVGMARARSEQAAADSRYAAQQALAGGSAAEWSGNSAQDLSNSQANSTMLSGALQATSIMAGAFGSGGSGPATPGASSSVPLAMNWNAGGPLFDRYGMGGYH